MIRVPYGISNFEMLSTEDYYFVDKTHFIAVLESQVTKYHFFLRPRKFGKSLWISILTYYYGIQHKEKFAEIFGKYEIGKNPTKRANTYLILTFDCSGINTETKKSTYDGFFAKIQAGIYEFFEEYVSFFTKSQIKKIEAADSPENMLSELLRVFISKKEKLYILIDEYDHFANELLAFDFQGFKNSVSKNGFVRKFYEVIKTGTRDGTVGAFFATGVSPITLDSMTSGFNIARNISLEVAFHDMLGFTEAEVLAILKGMNLPEKNIPALLDDVRRWYDGYIFNKEAENHLYNPNMTLYFAFKYAIAGKYPAEWIDVNIASDYNKIRKQFEIESSSTHNWDMLRELLKNGHVLANITQQFSFDKTFGQEDLISMLFYLGMLTLAKGGLERDMFKIPNLVIKGLYFNYFADVLMRQANIHVDIADIKTDYEKMIFEDNPRYLLKWVELTLAGLSNRDKVGFDEKYVKSIFCAYLALGRSYYLDSEREVSQKYTDILLLERPPYEVPQNYLFELKYLPKSQAVQLATLVENTKTQLKGYLQTPEIQAIPKLSPWVIVIVGIELKVLERA